MPPKGVLTPEALFTALLEKDPATGIEWKNEPITLHSPRANISCVASRGIPRALNNKKY